MNRGPVTFRVGSAEVLGSFAVEPGLLVVELAHIDGGGEGVLIEIWSLAARLAGAWGLAEVQWRVHAVTCAAPNPRLRAALERRGFTVAERPTGPVYELRRSVAPLGSG